METKKVLQINASENYGGVSAVIYNFYNSINKDKYKFTFLSPRKSSFKIKEKEILKNKDKIVEFNINKKGLIFYINVYKKYKKYIKNNNYDVIHINSGLILYNAIIAYLSKKYSSSIVIVHSHSAYKRNILKRFICLLFKRIICNNADYLLACSNNAAKTMFTKKVIKNNEYTIIPNGIDIEKFKFNKEKRDKLRSDLKIKDSELILGSIARLSKVKNHIFILNLLERIIKNNDNIKLILIGDGEEKDNIMNVINEKGLNNNVIMLGEIDNVNDYYNALDILLLPSFTEGLPLTIIESQVNGLKSIISDTITKEVKLTDLVYYEDIKDYDKWISLINRIEINRRDHYKELFNSKYNIKNSSKEILKYY